jgi:hypothetical protein
VALPTAAQVRALTIRNLSGTAEDTSIETMISIADTVCARWCYYPPASDGVPPTLEEADYVVYPAPRRDDPRRVRTLLRPIVSVTTVLVDTSGDWSYATTVPSGATGYVADSQGEIALAPASTYAWSTARRGNKITLSVGYDVGATPDLTLAIALLVAHWRAAGFVPTGATSVNQGGQSLTLTPPAGLPAEVQALLDPYRLVERETHGVPR